MEYAVLRTLAGFLNNGGGTLVVGVADDGNALGLAVDGFENDDKTALHLVNIIKSRIGPTAATNVHLHFGEHDGCRVLVAKCRASDSPVFVQDGGLEKSFVRTGPSTTELTASQTHEFVKQRFS